ncbi:MAG: hypothetical protein BWZ02_01915 [Lentisphaerae bacterium ADurb.BinA184]|nr:MAG: hypothetical protein BWZ02_01915 [Lentisphaerae bacterium ADurb.BinA184]
MPTKDNPPPPPAPDAHEDAEALAQTIEALEGILRTFPQDVTALESLGAAYQHAGRDQDAVAVLHRLAELLSQQNEWRQVYAVARSILQIEPQHPSAGLLRQSAVENLRLQGIDLEAAAEPSPPVRESEARGPGLTADLSGELELGWFLLQHNRITQNQYEAAVAGLTESRTRRRPDACLSLLDELARLPGMDSDALVGFLAAETMTPFVEITRFELRPEICGLIPLEDARRLGVLPFERIRNEVMLAVLNPVDSDVSRMVSRHLGCKTHVFLTSPAEFHRAIEQLARPAP